MCVFSTSAESSVLDMFAGDSVSSEYATNIIKTAKIGISSIGAFTKGRIRFENATLKEALDEFARYGGNGLVASKEVENIKITGSFDALHSDTFAPALAVVAPIKFEKKNGYTLIVGK